MRSSDPHTLAASAPIDQQLQQALALYQQGQQTQAEQIYQAILQLEPRHVAVLHLLGVSARKRADLDAALLYFERALSVNPNYIPALNGKGSVLRQLNRSQEALASYERALALQPDHAESLNNCGTALRDLKRMDEALSCYERVLRMQPDYFAAHYNRANLLLDLERYEEALAGFDRVLQLQPHYVDAHRNRGNALAKLKRFESALASYNQTLVLQPDYVQALTNRGSVLASLHRCEDALADYDRALALEPTHVDAWYNRGIVLRDLNRINEAIDSYAQVLRLQPEHMDACWNHSLCQLLMGNFTEGWRGYEARWHNDDQLRIRRNFSQPIWSGQEDLRGKTILLHAEQGLGDAIQFCRYVPLVAERGACVKLAVQDVLKPLMHTLAGVEQLFGYSQMEPLPEFDYHCPFLSLPLAFDTQISTIPAVIPYLHADAKRLAQWGERLGPAVGRLRIGLSWSGNALHKNDENRSMTLSCLQPLLQQSTAAQFFVLQKEIRSADQLTLIAHPEVLDLSAQLSDFADTAALVELMDLVISVDTSLVHVAGALDKPAWVLLPHVPDFRWLLERSDSPWYPSLRLFRQTQRGDWSNVVGAVLEALHAFKA